MRRTILIAAVMAVLYVLCVRATVGADVPLAWDPPTTNTDGTPLTDLAGYRISYAASDNQVFWPTNTAPGVQIHHVDVATTNATVMMLAGGTEFRFAVQAVNESGLYSDYSDELAWTSPSSIPSAPIRLRIVSGEIVLEIIQ